MGRLYPARLLLEDGLWRFRSQIACLLHSVNVMPAMQLVRITGIECGLARVDSFDFGADGLSLEFFNTMLEQLRVPLQPGYELRLRLVGPTFRGVATPTHVVVFCTDLGEA